MAVSIQDSMAATADSSTKLIREDRVWEYAYRAADEISAYDKPGAGWEIIQMKFDGTEQKDGVDYARFCTKSVQFGTVETSDDSERTWLPLNESYDDPRVYLMREENGKAWTWVEPDMRKWDLEGCTETMVYDITARNGETVDIVCGIIPFKFCTKVTPTIQASMDYVSSENIEIGGESCREVTIDVDNAYFTNVKLIEGVGYAESKKSTGILAVPQLIEYDLIAKYPTILLRQYDTDGNVLYDNTALTKYLLPVPAGLRLSAESSVGIMMQDIPEAWYTLQGVRVAQPQRGELLIRVSGGKAEKIRY
ncbi:MAG: hypothetical protein K2N09_02440 [Muribaculaceae bacterium]|nr:hypothetical protein [Muribaculaceae bacterium]